MPKYFYTARSLKGEPKSGVLEVKDRSELSRVLRQEGYLLISANLEEEEIKEKRFEISLPFGGVGLKEKMFFTRNLKVMIAAGLPLPRALKILADQSKSKKFRRVLSEVREEVVKGTSFSQSLSRYPDIFSELFQNMIKVGEEAGTMEEVLATLTQQMERENELKSKIKGAMIYPSVIISAMVGIGILMLIMVVPRLAETFAELHIELPFTTKIVISIGIFMATKWYFGILIIIVFIGLLRTILRTKVGKRVANYLILKIPIISTLIKKTNSAHTTRTLSSLIVAGVPIVRSLEIVSGALGNVYFREAMQNAAERVRKGERLSEVLKPHKNLYPPVVLQMIEVGEETGETSAVLAKLADFFEEEVANAAKNLSSIIEPVLMLLIGGAVGFFAISMVQPIYSMLGAIK